MIQQDDNRTSGILVLAFLLVTLPIITHSGELFHLDFQKTPFDSKCLLSNKKELQLAAVGNINKASALNNVDHAHTPFFFMPVSVNDASIELLGTVPGVGPRTAARIVEFRTKEGRVSSIDQLLAINGIGPKKLARIKPHLTVQ